MPWKLERLDSSQWQIGENRITRPSQWSDLLITDSGSSLPLPTTKNSGDGRMRRCSAQVTSFGTKDDANMPQQIWRVRLQRAQRRANDLPAVRWKGRDHRPSTPYQQRHLMTLTPAMESYIAATGNSATISELRLADRPGPSIPVSYTHLTLPTIYSV